MNYLVVCYKPDSTDSVMSCVRAHYSSDYQVELCATEEKVIDFIAGLNSREFGMGEDEFEYEIYRPNPENNYNIEQVSSQLRDAIQKETKVRVAARIKETKAAQAKRDAVEEELKWWLWC